MTTYKDSNIFQWNFINSSSQLLSITLSPQVLSYISGVSGTPNTVAATLYDSVLSYQECDDYSVPYESQFAYDGSTSISLAANSTLTLYGTYGGKDVWFIAGDGGVSDQPTVLVNGEYALFAYGNNDDLFSPKQYVNIEGQNGFTVTEDTKTQNNVTGNGVEIQNGGAGGPLNTDNMCFQISDLGATQVGSKKSDQLNGSSLNDVISGLGSSDRIYGKAGIDYLIGGKGRDLLDGGDDRDILIGNEGKDKLIGGNGNDFLEGGAGADFLSGGEGLNTYYWDRPLDGRDVVSGFKTQNDILKISAEGFGGDLMAGEALADDQFISGAFTSFGLLRKTQDNSSSSLFIYNTRTGFLFFDQDGLSGGSDPFVVAKFLEIPALSAADFMVVA